MITENVIRARRAELALSGVNAYDPGTREGLVDLLTDLMHYADRQSLDFADALRIATNHYDAEITEQA